jgi:hypothetical protein
MSKKNLWMGLVLCVLTHWGHAQGIALSKTDTVATIVAAQKGKRISLRLNSGQELTGVVRDLTDGVVVLESLSGRELFEAAIPFDAVEAVIVRSKP